MTIQFTQASRKKAYARILLAGPTGAGKTYTALQIASGLQNGSKIALLDTERGRANFYGNTVEFDHANLNNYGYKSYIEAIKAAEKAGYGVLVIDSASHAWEELVRLHDMMQGNSWANWSKITPLYNELVNAIVTYPGHTIVTARAKMKYEQNESRRIEPIGLEPIMRNGFEYEFDLYGMIDIDHNMTVRKTVMPFLTDAIVSKPGRDLGVQIKEWLQEGKAPTVVQADEDPSQYVVQTHGSSVQGKSLGEVLEANPGFLEAVLDNPVAVNKFVERDVVNMRAFLAQQ